MTIVSSKFAACMLLACSSLCGFTQNSPAPTPHQQSEPAKSEQPAQTSVEPDSTKLEMIKSPKVVYPTEAIQKGIQGEVRLRFSVSETGAVENIEVISRDPILAPAAVAAAKKWQFKPYILGG